MHEAVSLLLLLSMVFGATGQTMHKALTRRFGATATRLLSNFQATSAGRHPLFAPPPRAMNHLFHPARTPVSLLCWPKIATF